MKELQSLLLGERVSEPKGFANTYHRWTGEDGAKTSDPDNWSDYQYANAGITYMTDDGAPQLSWIARIENTSDQASTAHADADLEVLGLEIRGHDDNKANQSLVLGPGINLTGRNEIRITAQATLTIDGGTVSSLRWIDIHAGGTLNGHGSINATIYNNGSVAFSAAGQPALKLRGDYDQSADAALHLTIASNRPALDITGAARLGGTLAAAIAKGFKPTPGKSYTVLTADRIVGAFANPDNEVVSGDGSRFTIGYSRSNVTLTAK